MTRGRLTRAPPVLKLKIKSTAATVLQLPNAFQGYQGDALSYFRHTQTGGAIWSRRVDSQRLHQLIYRTQSARASSAAWFSCDWLAAAHSLYPACNLVGMPPFTSIVVHNCNPLYKLRVAWDLSYIDCGHEPRRPVHRWRQAKISRYALAIRAQGLAYYTNRPRTRHLMACMPSTASS